MKPLRNSSFPFTVASRGCHVQISRRKNGETNDSDVLSSPPANKTFPLLIKKEKKNTEFVGRNGMIGRLGTEARARGRGKSPRSIKRRPEGGRGVK